MIEKYDWSKRSATRQHHHTDFILRVKGRGQPNCFVARRHGDLISYGSSCEWQSCHHSKNLDIGHGTARGGLEREMIVIY